MDYSFANLNLLSRKTKVFNFCRLHTMCLSLLLKIKQRKLQGFIFDRRMRTLLIYERSISSNLRKTKQNKTKLS